VTDFLNLRGQAVVVTGAASGMGRAVARAACREGSRLVLTDLDGDRLRATAAELDGEVRYLRADVSDRAEIDAVFELAERELGRLDGLVTCAGIITTWPPLEVTSEEWDRVFAVNAKGTFFTIQAALRRMLPRGQGPHRHDRLGQLQAGRRPHRQRSVCGQQGRGRHDDEGLAASFVYGESFNVDGGVLME
jgi:NAD(P)-dependent dehydrogenase (short-subunit alcohol dehydrogenase family)